MTLPFFPHLPEALPATCLHHDCDKNSHTYTITSDSICV